MIKLSARSLAIKCRYKAARKMFKIERSFLDDFWIFIERNSVRKGVTDNNRERIKDTDEQCANPLGICNYSIDNSFVKVQIRLWIIKRSKSAHCDDESYIFFLIYIYNKYIFKSIFFLLRLIVLKKENDIEIENRKNERKERRLFRIKVSTKVRNIK